MRVRSTMTVRGVARSSGVQSRPPRKGTLGGPVCCHCPNRCSGGQGTVAARNMPFGLVRDWKRSEP